MSAVRDLKGRRVLVTGGTTGIGRGVAMVLAEGGARLFVSGWDDHLDEALSDVRRHDQGAAGLRIDLAEEGGAGEVVARAAEHLGGLDAVIANAGVPAGGILDTEEAEWRRAVAINYTSVLATCYHGARAMPGGGDVIVTGSMSAHRPKGGSSVYASANAGLSVFAETFRQEAGERGVKVSIVEPGKTGSDLFGDTYTDDEMAGFIAQDRMLEAEDVGRAVAYLLGQPSRCVGSVLRLEPRLHV